MIRVIYSVSFRSYVFELRADKPFLLYYLTSSRRQARLLLRSISFRRVSSRSLYSRSLATD